MMRAERGFAVVELLVTTVIVAALAVAVLAAVHAAPEAFSVDGEMADMHQRLRVAQGAIFQDLLAASAVRPYRYSGPAADPPGTFKSDTITAIGSTMRTFWLKADDRAGVYQLMSYAGGASADVPVVDNVVSLVFEYFGDPRPPAMVRPMSDASGPWTTYGPPPSRDPVGPFAAGESCLFVPNGTELPDSRLPALAPPGVALVPLEPSVFADGPWCPDDGAAERWDADLLRVRAVNVTLRVQAASAALRGPAGNLFAHGGTSRAGTRWAPDVEVRFQVAPRNAGSQASAR